MISLAVHCLFNSLNNSWTFIVAVILAGHEYFFRIFGSKYQFRIVSTKNRIFEIYVVMRTGKTHSLRFR